MKTSKCFSLFMALLLCLTSIGTLPVLAEDTPPFDGLHSDPRAMLLPDPAPLVEAGALNRTPNRAAAACTVPSDSYATIAAAVADPACDPIQISAGTYTENLVIERPVTIQGAGAISTTVDGGGVSAVFAITNTAAVTLTGMTIQNGAGLLVFTENNPDGTRIGGGVANWGGAVTITIQDSVIYSNTARYGGGVFNAGDAAAIVNTTIRDNTAQAAGGIGNLGTLSISNSEVFSNTASGGPGGGMVNDMGKVFIENSAFSYNVTTIDGGGIFNEDGSIYMYGSTLSHNVVVGDAHSSGGGLSSGSVTITATVEMTATAILSNSVIAGLGGGGLANHAALGTHALLRLEDCLVQGNAATGSHYMLGFGGGIKNGGLLVDEPVGSDPAEGVVLLNNSTVRGNQAVNGGGVGNGTLALKSPEMMRVIINNSTVSDNRAAVSAGGAITQTSNGGGIFNVNADMMLVNSTLSGNRAEGQPVPTTQSGLGGGIANVAAGLPGLVQLFNATIANNTAIGGGGVGNAYLVPAPGFPSAQVLFRNSLVAGNTDLFGATGCLNNSGLGGSDAATLISEGYNLEDSVTCGFVPGSNFVGVDARLGPLADNGGKSETHALLPGSPAIDAIPVELCGVRTDQRGIPRPQGPACDIGAYEVAAELHVTKTVTGVGDSTTDLPLGSVVTYTIVIQNDGDVLASGVVLTDALPSGVTFGTGVMTESVVFPAPDTLTWGPWDVPAGESYTLSFTANVTDSQTFAGQVITNTVVYASANAGSGMNQVAFTLAGAEPEGYHLYLPLITRTFSGSSSVTNTKLDFSR